MGLFKDIVKGHIEKKVEDREIKINLHVVPVLLEGEAMLDLSDLPPEDREKICNLLGGLYNEKTKSCVVKIKIDNKDPTKIKISTKID